LSSGEENKRLCEEEGEKEGEKEGGVIAHTKIFPSTSAEIRKGVHASGHIKRFTDSVWYPVQACSSLPEPSGEALMLQSLPPVKTIIRGSLKAMLKIEGSSNSWWLNWKTYHIYIYIIRINS